MSGAAPYAPFALAALVTAPVAAAAQPSDRPAPAPITVEVGVRDRHRSFFDNFGSEDTDASERDVERDLSSRRWLEVVPHDGEVTLEVTRRSVSESSRAKPKDGKLRVTWRYLVRATIRTRGDSDALEVSSTASEDLTESEANRVRRETYRDASTFRNLGHELAGHAADWILSRLDLLRPQRADAGFRHEVKHKWLLAGDGLEVTEVLPGSPAALAGLEPGDRIRAIDAEKGTSEMDRLVRTWWFELPGRSVRLEVERGKGRRVLECAILPPRQWAAADGGPPVARDGPPGVDLRTEREAAAEPDARVRPGMHPDEVERLLGRPQRACGCESKLIWTYDGFRVVFVGGVVSDVQ